MNKTETALLLALCASFDRRTVGDADVRAWQTVLADIGHQQAEAAVLAHYADSRDWVMPADIRKRVRQARAQALEDFQYEPADPDETPQQYLANRRRQMSAVAAGQRPAIVPGLPRAPRPLELAAVGQVPAEQQPARDLGPRSVRCPRCGVEPGKPCKTTFRGKPMADIHGSRHDAWRAA